MSRKLTIVLAATLAIAAVGTSVPAQATAAGGPTGGPVYTATADDAYGCFTPGMPFVVYAGDRYGNPLIVIDAGLIPRFGDPDLVLVIPTAPGANLFLQSGDTTIPIPPRDTVSRRPGANFKRLPQAPGGGATLGHHPVDLGLADTTPYLAWTRMPGFSSAEATAARPGTDPVQRRRPVDLRRFPTDLVQPAGLTSLGQGGALTNGVSDHTFGRLGQRPTRTRAGRPDIPPRGSVHGRDVVSLGRLLHADLGDVAVPNGSAYLGVNPEDLGLADDLPYLLWARVPDDGGRQEATDRPSLDPVQPRFYGHAVRMPWSLTQPGGLTSLGSGDGVTNGGAGHSFGRLGKTPTSPPRDTDPTGIAREVPGFARMPVPPGPGPTLGQGVHWIVIVGSGDLPSVTNTR